MPALLITANSSIELMLVVLAGYIAIQQLESYIIAPKLLGSSVKLNPFVILISIIIGGKLLGIIGALIAVPIVLIVQEIITVYEYDVVKSKNAGKN